MQLLRRIAHMKSIESTFGIHFNGFNFELSIYTSTYQISEILTFAIPDNIRKICDNFC